MKDVIKKKKKKEIKIYFFFFGDVISTPQCVISTPLTWK